MPKARRSWPSAIPILRGWPLPATLRHRAPLCRCGRDAAHEQPRLRGHRHHGAEPPRLGRTGGRARHPRHVQKPFATTLGDAKAMVEACKAAGVPLMVHENFRWQSPILKVRGDPAKRREIGEAFWGRVSFRSAYDVFFSGQPYLARANASSSRTSASMRSTWRASLRRCDECQCADQAGQSEIRGEDVATALLDHGHGVASVVDCSYATKLERELFPQTCWRSTARRKPAPRAGL